jgi:hypothetical protein
MTTNGEWLFSKPFEEQVAWMHEEHQDGTLDGDTAALNARINELRAHEREWRVLSKQLVDERELYREALSQLLDTVTDGMGKVSAILDNYDEGMA